MKGSNIVFIIEHSQLLFCKLLKPKQYLAYLSSISVVGRVSIVSEVSTVSRKLYLYFK